MIIVLEEANRNILAFHLLVSLNFAGYLIIFYIWIGNKVVNVAVNGKLSNGFLVIIQHTNFNHLMEHVLSLM